MLSAMSITQHSAFCGCLRGEIGTSLRLAMGRLTSLRPTHTFMGYTLPVALPVQPVSAIGLVADAIFLGQRRDERLEGDKHEFSHNILGWLNLITNNWSGETRDIPSLP
ncbi:MAG: hypothetical protein RLZZ511_3709 [Cyanobacteriota bacterium]